MQLKKEENKFYVEIKTVTWQKDSHGLFDYENNNHKQQKFVAAESCCLNQKNDEIKIDYDLGSELTSFKDDSVSLLNLTITRNSALVQQNTQANKLKNNYQQQFLIVRSLKNDQGSQKGYQIQIGDLIKLGRIEFKVIEMKGKELNPKRMNDHYINWKCESKSDDKSVESERVCRICYEDSLKQNCAPGDEQFVYLCQCKGSCANIHLYCLKMCINQKPIAKQDGNVTRYKMQRFECDLCKAPLPFSFISNNQKYTLLDLERPQKEPYIILEEMEHNKENNDNKNNNNTKNSSKNSNFFIIRFNESNQMSAKLGRGHSSEVRISDISVSRLHAKINFDSTTNDFLLYDNNSKFGSLVLLQKPFSLKHERIALQVGRTVITIFLKNINQNMNNFFDKQAYQMNFFKNNKQIQQEIDDFRKQVIYSNKDGNAVTNFKQTKQQIKQPQQQQNQQQQHDVFQNINNNLDKYFDQQLNTLLKDGNASNEDKK